MLQLSERNGFCIGFIDFMFKGKSFFEYTNLFSPNDYEGNDNIQIFSKLKRWKNIVVLFAVSIENLKNLKYHIS